MSTLDDIANAAQNFVLTYEMAMWGYKHHQEIEADLEVLEDAIRAYREATASATETRREG
jgi:hypothetical protein